MMLINAMIVARALSAGRNALWGVTDFVFAADNIEFATVSWFLYAGISCFLVLFAGIMSGLTLGLMSLGLVELEILQRSGTPTEKKQAGAACLLGKCGEKERGMFVGTLERFRTCVVLSIWYRRHVCLTGYSSSVCTCCDSTLQSLGSLRVKERDKDVGNITSIAAILPVVHKQHQLLVTLLLCNACAMEALPIYLDKIFHPFVAVLLSVSFVLVFGEIIPQAVCTRYGLAVGANFVWLVRILMIVCYPIAYPIGKVLDAVLGHSDALFRRAQLKALVSIHGEEAGKGGELSHDETTIISGALDLTLKTAEEAMTPIESTFSLDVNSKLDWEAVGKILARGHSRVPVYSGNPKNIIGLLLVKTLLTVRAETETPVSAVSIRRMPRVPADMPLYDILNEFQKGSSHMAAVVKIKGRSKKPLSTNEGAKFDEIKVSNGNLTIPLLIKEDDESDCAVVDLEKGKKLNLNKLAPQHKFAINTLPPLTEDIDDGEVIGIITLEDVFEELLQEEIVDETDVYIDVHKRIRVAAAAAAAASVVARIPSSRKLTGQKIAASHNKQGPASKK